MLRAFSDARSTLRMQLTLVRYRLVYLQSNLVSSWELLIGRQDLLSYTNYILYLAGGFSLVARISSVTQTIRSHSFILIAPGDILERKNLIFSFCTVFVWNIIRRISSYISDYSTV